MPKTIPAMVTGFSLTAAVLLTATFAHPPTGTRTEAVALESNTAQLCPVVVRLWNLEANRVGTARPGSRQDRAWTDYVTSTRALAALSTDAVLKQDLTLAADGMVRISGEPGRDLNQRVDHLAQNDPADNAALTRASDRIEATCGPVTGAL